MSGTHWDALLVSSSRALGLPQPQPESIVRCYGKRPYARASVSCTAHIVGRDDGLTLCGLYVNGLIGPDNRVDRECKVCARIASSWAPAPAPSEATPAPAPVDWSRYHAGTEYLCPVCREWCDGSDRDPFDRLRACDSCAAPAPVSPRSEPDPDPNSPHYWLPDRFPAPAPVRTTVRRVSCTGRLIYQHESRSLYGNVTGSSVYRCSLCGDHSAIIFAGGYRVDGRTCRSAVYMRVTE